LSDNIISHAEMCVRERTSLQKGMNFGIGGNHSVILMSVRPNAPYRDRLEDGGSILVYEGHDVPRSAARLNPKLVDQPERYPGGTLTENGKFHRAAQAAKAGAQPPERVRVYEKIKPGIWAYNGMFHLVDSWIEPDEHRQVFRFRLMAVQGDEDFSYPPIKEPEKRRIIPTEVKRAVWKRDGGKCVTCGATNELHFDHIIPWSRGGSSIVSDNVQLLCARHNIAKHAKIE
jgi:hypothetical protein